MSHYMDFEPGMIRSRNEQMRREVCSLRLQERLRKNRDPDGSRLDVAPVRKAVLAFILVAVAIGGLLAVADPASASTTFVVNSTGDENDADFPAGNFDGSSDGKCDVTAFTPGDQCTLRAAIQEANRTTDQDTVNFNIPGTGVKTIAVGTPGYGIGNGVLPAITQPLIIDGYTQPGSKKNDLAVGTNAILRIQIGNGGVGLGGSGLYVDAPGSVVRGLVINGFNSGSGASGGVILEGNFIGTDPSGTQAPGQVRGVVLRGDDNQVGQGSRASRNLISGNERFGIGVFGTQSTTIVNNLIGTASDGKSPLGNAHSGILVDGGSLCTVGTDSPEAANTIAFNGEDGVQVYDGSSRVALARNSIFSNTGLGIDLVGPGENSTTDIITPNDFGDADAGANGLQNSPVLTSASTSSRKTSVRGTLDSTGSTAFLIRLFSDKDTDEGKNYIGQKLVATDGTGHAGFTFTTRHRIAVGQAVTATATALAGDTSEFSESRKVLRR